MILIRLSSSMSDTNKKKNISDFNFHKCESCENCKKVINKYGISKVYYY